MQTLARWRSRIAAFSLGEQRGLVNPPEGAKLRSPGRRSIVELEVDLREVCGLVTETNRFFEQISMFVAQAIADLDGVDLAEVRASVPSSLPLLFSSVRGYFERQG